MLKSSKRMGEISPPDQALLRVHRAARYLDCSVWTLRRLVYAGQLVGVKVGSNLCVEKSQLDLYIATHRTKQAAER
jgi:excisionase family DNA binding protein